MFSRKKSSTEKKRAKETEPPDLPDPDLHLLLVDDDDEFLLHTAGALTKKGFSVYTANNGVAGLGMLRKHTIDVAFVDIQMEEMDGLAWLHFVKQEQPLVEIILLTGHASVESAVGGLKEGAFDYLIKPESTSRIAQVALAAVSKKRKAEEVLRQKEIDEMVRRSPT